MKNTVNAFVLAVAALGLLVVDLSPTTPLVPGFVPEAAALIGRPVSPMSFAGVARRTTRRAVYAESAAVATTAAVAATPAATTGAVPIGTVITTLPAGCAATTIGGVEYHQCDGTYYRAAFQGNNLVYVATQP